MSYYILFVIVTWTFLVITKERQLEFIGHAMRKGEQEYPIISEFVEGKRTRDTERHLLDLARNAIDTNRAHPPEKGEICLERVVQVAAFV